MGSRIIRTLALATAAATLQAVIEHRRAGIDDFVSRRLEVLLDERCVHHEILQLQLRQLARLADRCVCRHRVGGTLPFGKSAIQQRNAIAEGLLGMPRA